MASNNNIYKMSNAGGFKSLTRYYDMLAGNTVWNPWSPAGAYESIATVTVGATAQASITFSGIPSTYKHLQVRALYKCSTTDNPYMRVNGATSSIYSWHHLYGDGATAASNGNGTQTFTYFGYSQNTTNPNAGVIDILDYANTDKYKTFRILAGQDNNGGGEVALWSGSYQNTSAISSITFTTAGTFTQYSSFALYGIQGN
jgi:hypothetical protein